MVVSYYGSLYAKRHLKLSVRKKVCRSHRAQYSEVCLFTIHGPTGPHPRVNGFFPSCQALGHREEVGGRVHSEAKPLHLIY